MSENLPATAVPAQAMSDEDILAFTQAQRANIVREMTLNGVPADKGEKIVLLTALGDMDRTALGKLKIGSKERQGAADRAAAAAIAKVFSTLGGRSPFEIQPGQDLPQRQIPLELDESELTELTLAPGETDVGISEVKFEDFMTGVEQRMGK